MIKTIQADTQTAVKAMEEGTSQVQAGVHSTAEAGDALREIIHMAEQVGQMITQIATAGAQQSATAERVKESMQQIADLVQQTTAEAHNAAKSCEGLSQFALDLQRMVGSFRLESSPDPQASERPQSGSEPAQGSYPSSRGTRARAATAN